MKYRLLDLLACPICKTFPLEFLVFQENVYPPSTRVRVKTCEEYCGLLKRWVKDGRGDCNVCFTKEVAEGILICTKCGRWYPIMEEIPRMLPDELREAKEDLEFLKKYKDKTPKWVLEEGKPFNLSGAS
ncbi:MAG: Trm112 family protein [Candidatus Nezhaarchaeales archaeon]